MTTRPLHGGDHRLRDGATLLISVAFVLVIAVPGSGAAVANPLVVAEATSGDSWGSIPFQGYLTYSVTVTNPSNLLVTANVTIPFPVSPEGASTERGYVLSDDFVTWYLNSQQDCNVDTPAAEIDGYTWRGVQIYPGGRCVFGASYLALPRVQIATFHHSSYATATKAEVWPSLPPPLPGVPRVAPASRPRSGETVAACAWGPLGTAVCLPVVPVG